MTDKQKNKNNKKETDGAGVINVNKDGELGNIEFTKPAEGISQDIYKEPPEKRVNTPDSEEIDTPSYGIRKDMNNIDTPDDKTWFMELNESVIDEGRCIKCGTCVAACPSDSIGINEEDNIPELVKMCTGCSLCWDFCPRGGLRYEKQWKITGEREKKGPIKLPQVEEKSIGSSLYEYTAKVNEKWRNTYSQDGGVVTSILINLLEKGEIDGALIATESKEETWKAESYLATTPKELIENAGSFYTQTMALGNLNFKKWKNKLPDKDWEDINLALVGTPCEIEGIRALQDFDWDYKSHEEGVRSIKYTIALLCTKSFNYKRLIGDEIKKKRNIHPENIGKIDVIDGDMKIYNQELELIHNENVKEFHGAALKGCDECADFIGMCADISVGSVGSEDEFSSVIIRTKNGEKAWYLSKSDLTYRELDKKTDIENLQSWDKKKALDSLNRPFDPEAPRFIDYKDHAEKYGTDLNPHESENYHN